MKKSLKESLLVVEKSKNDKRREKIIRKIIPYRLNITPLGIEDFKKGDESFTYRRKDTVWYKANSEAEPEILAYKGWHILNYHEFVSDIDVNRRRYRVFYNPIAKKVFVNELVKAGKRIYLKNPVNKEMSELLFGTVKELPKKNRLDTIAHLKKNIEKFNKQEELSSQSEKKSVGNVPKANLIKATKWCIKTQPRYWEYKRQTLLRAYKIFGEKSHTKESFVKMVRSKWNNVMEDYNAKPEEFRKQNSRESYAKSVLTIPRNNSKQKTKKKEKTFNY
jgi:hypothetical protein